MLARIRRSIGGERKKEESVDLQAIINLCEDEALQNFVSLVNDSEPFFREIFSHRFGELKGFLQACKTKNSPMIQLLLPSLKAMNDESIAIPKKALFILVLNLMKLKIYQHLLEELQVQEDVRQTIYSLIANTKTVEVEKYGQVFSAEVVPEDRRAMLLIILCILGGNNDVNHAFLHGYDQYLNGEVIGDLKKYHYDGLMLIMPAFLSGVPLDELYRGLPYFSETGRVQMLYETLKELAVNAPDSLSTVSEKSMARKKMSPHELFYLRLPFKQIRAFSACDLAIFSSRVLNTSQTSQDRANTIRAIILAIPQDDHPLKLLLKDFVGVWEPTAEIFNSNQFKLMGSLT